MSTTTRRPRITWTEDEWDKLAEFLFKRRLNSPKEALSSFYENALEQFPENRRRAYQQNIIDELEKRVKAKIDAVILKAREYERLLPKINQVKPDQSAAEFLAEISDHELTENEGLIVNRIGLSAILSKHSIEDILQAVSTPRLVGETVSRLLGDYETKSQYFVELIKALPQLLSQQAPQQLAPQKMNGDTKRSLPKVVLVGYLKAQHNEIERKFQNRAKVIWVDKDRKTGPIPYGDIICFLASKNGHHGIKDSLPSGMGEKTTVLEIHGGVETTIEKLDYRLP